MPLRSLMIAGEYFPPRTGGISSMMAGIARHLGASRVAVLTGVPAGGERRADHEAGIPVHRHRLPFAGGRIRQALGLGVSLPGVLLRERPAVTQAATVFDAYLSRKLRRFLGIPYLVYAHGNEIAELSDAGAWKGHLRALREASAVLANSGYTAELVRGAGVAGDRVHVVHPGCDTDTFAPSPDEAAETARRLGWEHGEGPVLLSVGHLVRRKGHDVVLQSLERLTSDHPDLRYLIVGTGGERDRLEAIAESRGVRDHVRFVGHVPDDELSGFYNLADVFVMVSRAREDANDVEGFGIVYLEASACEVPVVGGRSGGVPDAIEDGTTGLLVDPTRPGEVAAAISRLLSDGDLARRMARAGRRRVLRHFRWPQVADRVHAIATSLT